MVDAVEPTSGNRSNRAPPSRSSPFSGRVVPHSGREMLTPALLLVMVGFIVAETGIGFWRLLVLRLILGKGASATTGIYTVRFYWLPTLTLFPKFYT